MADIIPIFPLSHVLMPGMPLPLHIFEQRYRRLLTDLQDGPGTPSFGVVALRRGSEVGSRNPNGAGPQVMEVGTLAEILEIEPYEDGASDLLTVGSRRFRIRSLVVEGTPYFRAEVDWIDEADGDLSAAEVPVCRRLAQDYSRLLESLTGRPRDDDLPTDPTMLSYHVAAHLPLPQTDRQSLLEEPTSCDRLRREICLLRREISLLQSTRSIAISPAVLQLAAHAN